MATDTQKPSDINHALGNPKKALDSSSVPPSATNPDRPEDPRTDTPNPAPSSDVPEQNLSKADSGDSKTAAGSGSGDDATPANAIEKKMRRAERFGISVQLTEEEKRNSRAERFGTVSPSSGSDCSKKSEDLKRKARAERFGLPGPAVASDEDAKKKARLARFTTDSKTSPKTDPLEGEKRKARALRFSNAASGSLTKVNDEDNVEPKAAIAGSAGRGV